MIPNPANLNYVILNVTLLYLFDGLCNMSQKYRQRNWQLSKVYFKRSLLNILSPRYQHKRHQLRHQSWLRRRIHLTYLKLRRLRGKPKTVAKGLAIGVFAGSFPFFGIQSLIAIFLATICRGSKVAAVAATWISNPLILCTTICLQLQNWQVVTENKR
jgi:hypothetical protein